LLLETQMKLGKFVVAAALLAVGASTASAQNGPEITVGLGVLSHTSFDGQTAFNIGINRQEVRLGIPVASKVMIEPSLSLGYTSSEGTTTTNLGVGAFVPFYLGESTSRGLYVAPGASLQYLSFDDDVSSGSASQVSLAFELGNKSRISDAVALRLAAQLMHSLENDDFNSATTVGALVGLSVRLK
jgi:hypothetical protein